MRASASPPTVADLWRNYAERRIPTLAPTGQRTANGSWKNLAYHFGRLTAPQVNQGSVDAYVRARIDGRIGRPAVPGTARLELAYLRAALHLAAKHKIITPSDIEPIDLPDLSLPRTRWLTIEEVQRLLDAAFEMRRGPKLSRLERFLWIALETGARKTAIMELRWGQIDFELGIINFAAPGHSPRKKTRASLAISKALLPVLKRAFAERESELVMTNQGAIWPSIQRAAIRARFDVQKVGGHDKPKGTGISPHVLRHTAATHMARRGVPLWIIAKCLGNSVEMIEKTYGHWVPAPSAVSTDLISNGELRPPS